MRRSRRATAAAAFVRWATWLAFALVIAAGAAEAWAQPRPAIVQAATPNDAIYESGLAELRRRMGGLASVHNAGPQDAAQVLAALRRGEIDVGILPLAALREVAPGFAVYELAFTLPDALSMRHFSQEVAPPRLSAELKSQGLAGLATWYGGALVIAARQPMRSPADFKGSRLLVRSDAATARQFAAAGIQASSLPAANAFTALERGAVDAVELTWQEVAAVTPAARYVAETNHRFLGHVVLVDPARLQRMPEATRRLLREALRDISNDVSRRVAEREALAHRQALQMPGLTVLSVDQRLREEWRSAMASAQADEIRRIGPEFVERATLQERTAAAALSRGSSGLTWNAWFQDSPRVPEHTLSVGTAYQFKLDLARLAYPNVLSSTAEARLMAEIERQREAGEITLLVRPVLVGGVLRPLEGTDFGARPLRIRTDRLAPKAEDRARVEDFKQGRLSLQQLAAELSVADALSWSVVPREAGCARIALSVWDALGLRPLDYLVVSIAAARPGERAPDCHASLRGGQLVSGMQTLLQVDPAQGADGARMADAALHLFDIERSGAERGSTVAVYVDRKEFEGAAREGRLPNVHAWELDTLLSDFLGQPAKLQDSLNSVRAALGKVPQPYGDVVRQLDAALFGGRTADDQRAADMARRALQGLAQQAAPPRVLVRYLGEYGQLRYLPLALLAADAPVRVLAQRVTVVQPLAQPPRAEAAACFDSWNLAIPRRLDGVRADDAELLRRDDWRVGGERLAWHEDNPALLRYLSTTAESRSAGEALVLLAHHGEGKLTYSSAARPDRILDEEVRRNFGPGSVAVLAACSTAGISDASRAFLQKLLRRGVEAFVVSPFQVDASFGTHLAVSFVGVAAEARRSGETPRIVDLYERALQKTIDSFANEPGYRDMALEFQLIGNHELRLCAPPR